MTAKIKKNQVKVGWLKITASYILGVLAGLIGLIAVTRAVWHGKFYPNVYIAGNMVGGKTRDEVKAILEQKISGYKVVVSYNGYSWEIPSSSIKVIIDQTINNAYRVGRRADLRDYLLVLVNKAEDYPLILETGNSEELSALTSSIGTDVEIPALLPEIEVTKGQIELVNGSDGVELDESRLINDIRARYQTLSTEPVEATTTQINNRLSEEEIMSVKAIAKRLLAGKIEIELENEKTQVKGEDLVAWIATEPGTLGTPNKTAISQYVLDYANIHDHDPEDAKFEFENGKVTEFASGRDGITINKDKMVEQIASAIQKIINDESASELINPVLERKSPQVTIDKINELGIKELIGRGESYYYHSIPNRIFNVNLASSRINSALIAPNEEVSFNKLVGEVSASTGYRPAYIISQGRTVLGDGGGLCQVSTTMFRAAMSAGLPITERWGHSYRVSYYELNSKPGVDATVIAPSKDLKFFNDTPGHILIQTINDPKNLHLVIEIYGTSDGRVATISEPKVWGITPPLPTIYQDDPSLPNGTLKQVDWAASGAHASFEYDVNRDGENLIHKVFSTTYQPWASVYLRGTGN